MKLKYYQTGHFDPEDTKDYRNEFWNWMGCLPVSISILILVMAYMILDWALSGYPGLVCK